MSLIGKGASSFRKKDVIEQKSVALGFKKIKFAHKATLGDTGFTLTALVQPTEMATYGFVNPNPTDIARSQVFVFRNNLKLMSSLRGMLVDQLSYSVAGNNRINFIDFTAEDGEIFIGWLDEAPTTSLSVVDGKTIIASGTLLAGQTDFNIGTPIVINANPSQQIGAVMAFVDRGLQYRKVGNVTGGDGDYIEVPVAGGLGSLLRFNASGVDRFVMVVSNGVVTERPDGSQTALIERVQGQIDAMIPTLAVLAGVPENTFQTAPNSVDLKQFGDTVIGQQTELDDHETRIDALEGALTPYCVYQDGGGSNSVAVPGNFNTFKYATFVEGTSSMYNPATGVITFPIDGLWHIHASVTFAGTLTVNQSVRILFDNEQQVQYGNGGNNNYHVQAMIAKKYTAGNTLTIGFDASIVGNSMADSRSNRLKITYMGKA